MQWCATNALKEALLMCDNRNLHQIKGSRVTRIQADGGGEFTNKQVRDLCWEKNIVLSYSPAHQPSSNGIAERNGWNVEDHGSENAQTGQSRERMVVICVQICWTYDARKSTRTRMDISSIWTASWHLEIT